MRLAVAAFLVAVFGAAFLIFGVQPMVGKHILPWFGGAPAVWMTCLAFYQTTLFVGYAYAYGLAARVPPRLHPLVHGALFLAALAVLPVLPDASWKPDPEGSSAARILAMLGVHVALPFGLLAATGPLLQVWFARAWPARSPYPLYALSNLGSLLGLLSFPFWVEPQLPLPVQSRLWSLAFLGIGGLVVACAAWSAFASPTAARAVATPAARAVAPLDVVAWLGLPAAAVMMFMGVTNHLTLEIASFPFLWIVPLSIYLVSLVLCFASERLYRRDVFLPLAAASLAWVLAAASGRFAGEAALLSEALPVATARISLALFAGCMVAHGELARIRPDPSRLTTFYLCIAAGGALGGLFVGLAAPQLFDHYLELPLGAALCWGLVALSIARAPTGAFAGPRRRLAWGGVAVLTLGAALASSADVGREPGLLVAERNFFGVLRVIRTEGRTPFTVLRHGSTRHGIQYEGEALRRRPTSYYGITTGAGLLLTDAMQTERGLRIGVIGLGIGTLAAYGRAQDAFTFYEIDPAVVRVARDSGFFTYLDDSLARSTIVLGDARLSLERELDDESGVPFDVLVVDAFTSDAVPLHLLTVEAFSIYTRRLAPDGVLALHVSNRNLDLTAPVARLAQAAGLENLVLSNPDSPQLLSETAQWVMLARRRERLDRLDAMARRLPAQLGRPRTRSVAIGPQRLARTPLWTDDWSNLLAVLRRGRSR